MASVWIFQCNPDSFDIDGYLKARKEITWSINQEYLADEMLLGDLVYIWRAGGVKKEKSGIIASARISKAPSKREEDLNALPYWKDVEKNNARLRVSLFVECVANKKGVVDRRWLEKDPILHDLKILKIRTLTNYKVPKSQEKRLKSLWDRTGVDWSWEESVAGLWTYDQLEGKTITEATDSLVAKTAISIGRAVSSVYTKVQNFRALDSRDKRRGLSSWSATDEKVWKNYYDSDKKVIKHEELNNEFGKIWRNLNELVDLAKAELGEVAIPQNIENQFAFGKEGKSGGQGHIRNPELIRAIEHYAVDYVRNHYEENGFSVRETGNTESYDLSCFKVGKERRVKVKGTSTWGATVILTRNEVEHSLSQDVPVDLALVYDIEIIFTLDGPLAFGGVLQLFENWKPREEDLTIATYYYRLERKDREQNKGGILENIN